MKQFLFVVLLFTNFTVFAQMTPLERANEYRFAKKYPKAIQLLKGILENAPRNYEAYLALADCYASTNERPKEEAVYKKALEIIPLQPLIYVRYGDFLMTRKRLDDAENLFKQGIHIIPGDADLYYYLGAVFRKKKNYKKSYVNLAKAIELNKDDPYYYYFRAFSSKKMGNNEAALEDFNKAIELAPDNGGYHHSRMLLKFKMKDYPGALADAQKAQASGDESYKNAVQTCKRNIAREYSRLYSEWENKDIRKALEYLKKAVEWTPSAKSRQTYVEIIEIKETALKEAETKQRFEAEIATTHQQSIALVKAKKYKEAYALLDAILRKMTGTEQVLLPAYEKMLMLRLEVKWAIEDLEKKKD